MRTDIEPQLEKTNARSENLHGSAICIQAQGKGMDFLKFRIINLVISCLPHKSPRPPLGASLNTLEEFIAIINHSDPIQ